ncbi:MAG: hypothetical protein ACTSVI_13515 [Promethearchaeota archaeon]
MFFLKFYIPSTLMHEKSKLSLIRNPVEIDCETWLTGNDRICLHDLMEYWRFIIEENNMFKNRTCPR